MVNLQVKPDHSFVNMNGLVNIPYTQRWVSSINCTLRDMVINLISIFSNEPPLFAKPADVEEPIPSWVLDDSRASAAMAGSLSARNHSSNSSSGRSTHTVDNFAVDSNQLATHVDTSSSSSSSSSDGKKTELIEQVTLKMQAYMHQRLTKICEQIDTELWTQQRLNERILNIEQHQRELRAKSGKFKESSDRVKAKIVQLDEWASQREKNLQEKSESPDSNVVAHDGLSSQIVGITSFIINTRILLLLNSLCFICIHSHYRSNVRKLGD